MAEYLDARGRAWIVDDDVDPDVVRSFLDKRFKRQKSADAMTWSIPKRTVLLLDRGARALLALYGTWAEIRTEAKDVLYFTHGSETFCATSATVVPSDRVLLAPALTRGLIDLDDAAVRDAFFERINPTLENPLVRGPDDPLILEQIASGDGAAIDTFMEELAQIVWSDPAYPDICDRVWADTSFVSPGTVRVNDARLDAVRTETLARMSMERLGLTGFHWRGAPGQCPDGAESEQALFRNGYLAEASCNTMIPVASKQEIAAARKAWPFS